MEKIHNEFDLVVNSGDADKDDDTDSYSLAGLEGKQM